MAFYFIPFIVVGSIFVLVFVSVIVATLRRRRLNNKLVREGETVVAVFMSATQLMAGRRMSPYYSIKVMYRDIMGQEYTVNLLRAFTQSEVRALEMAQKFPIKHIGNKATVSQEILKELENQAMSDARNRLENPF